MSDTKKISKVIKLPRELSAKVDRLASRMEWDKKSGGTAGFIREVLAKQVEEAEKQGLV